MIDYIEENYYNALILKKSKNNSEFLDLTVLNTELYLKIMMITIKIMFPRNTSLTIRISYQALVNLLLYINNDLFIWKFLILAKCKDEVLFS